MKNILFIIGLTFLASFTQAQEVKDVKRNTIAYITRSTIQNSEKQTLCVFQPDGRIVDGKANTIGYLVNNAELQDKDRKTVAYIQFDGTVQDANKQKIGSIMYATGPVISNGTVIATMENVEPTWAAAYFFLFRFQEKL